MSAFLADKTSKNAGAERKTAAKKRGVGVGRVDVMDGRAVV